MTVLLPVRTMISGLPRRFASFTHVCICIAAVSTACASLTVEAQFVDHFNDASLVGWDHATGDGRARMELVAGGNGHATIHVDATSDRYNIWWALIRRDVSGAIDLERLDEPHHELRIEARIRVSHAPRRVNLHLNTQRTTDFHTHLMEFDISDTTGWHVISMTTSDFEAGPGDTVNGQMALIDWGLDTYRADVDYFRVDVVDTTRVGPDRGDQVPYGFPIPPLESFSQQIEAAEAGMIDLHHPDVRLDEWHAVGPDHGTRTPVLTVDGGRYVLLRWDLEGLAGRDVSGHGVLTLSTHSLNHAEPELEEFGQIRVVEIYGGDPRWEAETLTLDGFTEGRPLDDIVNSQMVVDVRPARRQGALTYVRIGRPVLQRMIDGETRGLLLRPLGPVSASFYAGGEEAAGPVLRFNVSPER